MVLGPGQVIMPRVWSQADTLMPLVYELASKHGLATDNQREGRVIAPTNEPIQERAWRRFWENAPDRGGHQFWPHPRAWSYWSRLGRCDAL
jgi:hypothetical protein